MKLLVTGGAGFIGSNFIHYWLKNHPEDQIINIDKLTYAGNLANLDSVKNNPNYSFIKGDICDPKVVDQAMVSVDVVVSFAAESHVDRSITGPAVFVMTNVVGTQVLLDAALKHQVKRFHHISCYDKETQALTKNGLKTYKEIKKDDLVLTLNQNNHEVEWKPVEKVIIQDYEGEMIKLRTRTTDFLVTPNHRMFFQTKRGKKLVYKIAEDIKKDAINKLPKYYQWSGKMAEIIKLQKSAKDFMYILGIFIGDGFTAYQENKVPNQTGLSKDEYLKKARNQFGQFSSVGKIGKHNFSTQKAWRIFLDIPERDSCRRQCEKSLDRLGISWHAHKGKAGEHIYFTSQKYLEIFDRCGKYAKNKRIPDWALNAPSELLLPLFKGLMDSDGSHHRVFFTSSKTLAYQFLELCVKLGFSPSLNTRFTKNRINGRKVEGFSYVISVGNQWRDIRRVVIKKQHYRGKIWCLKVKDNRNFLTVRNGKTAFCGNTDEVFGSLELNSQEKFSEATPFKPNSPYSASKAGSDHLVRAYHQTYGLPVTITNTSNNYGPFQFPEKLIPLTITNLLEGKKVPIYGDGLYVRDWLYVADHCRGIDLVLQKGRLGETYCLGGTTEDLSNLKIVKKIIKFMGKPEDSIEFVKDRPGHDRRYAIDWTKAQNELGYQPNHDFDTYLAQTIDWYKNNQSWWQKIKHA